MTCEILHRAIQEWHTELKRMCHGHFVRLRQDIPWKPCVDINILHFNTAVASLMGYLNYLQSRKQVTREEAVTYLLLLSPFAPHMTEELWSLLGKKTSIHLEKWPVYDGELIKDEKVTLVIQVDGKVRDRMVVDAGLSKEEALGGARKLEKVKKYVSDTNVDKVVFVPDKLINFVIKI